MTSPPPNLTAKGKDFPPSLCSHNSSKCGSNLPGFSRKLLFLLKPAFLVLLPNVCLGNWEPSLCLPGPYCCSLQQQQQHRNDVPVQFILLLLGKLMSRGTAAARRNSFPAVLREKSAGLGPGSNLIVQHICYANHLGEGESNQSGNQLCLRQKRTVGTRRRLSCSL